jgi:antitoxin component YwqK of YwqJK toxin-antitoxin module
MLYDKTGIKSFEGEWFLDHKQGLGISYYENGSRFYSGNFCSNKFHGYGIKFDRSDHEACRGYFKNNILIKLDLRDLENLYSKGILLKNPSFGDESFYMGCMEAGGRNGLGVSFDREGNKIYEGLFRNNQREGKGVSYNYWGDREYHGEWQKGARHGSGVQYNLEGGVLYQGKWENGKPGYVCPFSVV